MFLIEAILSTIRSLPPILFGGLAGAVLATELHVGGWHLTLVLLACMALAAVLYRYVRVVRWLMMLAALAALPLAVARHSPQGAIWLAAGMGTWLLLKRYLRQRHLPRAVRTVSQRDTVSETALPVRNEYAAQESSVMHVPVQRARFGIDAIMGMSETKQRLLNAARDILERPEHARNGILLHGEPGNGKTMFAEAIAGELGLPFLSVSYQDVASKWVNETPTRISEVFAQARRLGTAVLFIDEVDGFIKSRHSEQSHSMDRDVTNTMLTEIVRLRSSRVVLVAATNNLAWLDAAATREARFDFKVLVPAPDLPARLAILKRTVAVSLGPNAFAPALLQSLAARWAGFSVARLTAVGPQLADMRREGALGGGAVSFTEAMQAMRRIQGSGNLPEIIKPVEQIVMPDSSRDCLKQLAQRMKRVHQMELLGGALPRGVLFYGPPGTGKTQAAMSLAKATDWAFLKVTGAELLMSSGAWNTLYRRAKDLRPCIIFIDEADDVLKERRTSAAAPVTNLILASIDGADGRTPDVLVIAATNHPGSLDPAVTRGGRLEQKIRFDVPSRQSLATYVRTELATRTAGRFVLRARVLEDLIAVLDGSCLADVDFALQRIINDAVDRFIEQRGNVITSTHVRDALATLSFSPRPNG
jgi:transitional endoplasmic reticulum ATPase